MNDKALELLERLANKLGTTSEYLWTVLLRQATVDAIYNIIIIVLTIAFGILLYKSHQYFMVDEHKMSYYNQEEALGVPMFFGVVVLAVMIVFNLLSLSDIINGFFNPEFWALNYILKHLK